MPIPRSSVSTAAASWLAAALIAFAAGCATRPEVRVDKDPAVDLRTYKTFAFYDAPADRARYSALLNSHLRQATRSQLERRDLVYDERNPDLRVATFLQVADKIELRATPAAAGWRGYRSWPGSVDTVNYREGTLRIDLVDARRNALVWHGAAEGRLDDKALKDPGPAIDQVVGEILAALPRGAQR